MCGHSFQDSSSLASIIALTASPNNFISAIGQVLKQAKDETLTLALTGPSYLT
jgi:hypothetical protein